MDKLSGAVGGYLIIARLVGGILLLSGLIEGCLYQGWFERFVRCLGSQTGWSYSFDVWATLKVFISRLVGGILSISRLAGGCLSRLVEGIHSMFGLVGRKPVGGINSMSGAGQRSWWLVVPFRPTPVICR